MTVGIGVDIIVIDRIRKAILNERFVKRIFTPQEIEYCRSRKKGEAHSFSARFAAKEAVIKALNLRNSKNCWQEIEIVRNHEGIPHVQLTGECKRIAENIGVQRILLSLSHSDDMAVAYVSLCSN